MILPIFFARNCRLQRQLRLHAAVCQSIQCVTKCNNVILFRIAVCSLDAIYC